MKAFRYAVVATGLLIATSAPGRAALLVTGPGIGESYTSFASDQTLWSLVGGVSLPTTPGYDTKNAILHDYVVATGAGGVTSVFSLGEINPSFGGTNIAPYVAYSGGAFSLVDPNANASGRDVSNVTSLQVIAVPSLPTGPGGASSSVNLTGLVKNPGSYTLSQLENGFAPVSVTVSGDTYTGVPLYTFLNPSNSKITSQIVITGATDGYEVVYSLAELDPALGGNPQNLLPYASNGGDFPTDGIARTLFPDDNKHGRWVSNVDAISVGAGVPEPSTWALMLLGFGGLAFSGYRQGRKPSTLAA